jgi:glycosyltransferase involved in cell wall biosynthesis
MLSYDAVVATRNRQDALRLSLPMLLAQSRPPAQIVVVDSSDDPEPIRAIVEAAAQATTIPVSFVSSAPGLTRQRNIGLERVSAPVVFFPDDDSLVLPGAMAAVMRIYERDADGVIGGVCPAETDSPPEEVLAIARQGYETSMKERLLRPVKRLRFHVEHTLFPSPLYALGRRLNAARRPPSWLADENAVLVEHMTGFRMSFRTDVIRRSGFDERLLRYGLQEDVDASLQVMLSGRLLVGALNGAIYHHKARGGRPAGRRMGFEQVMNRAYLLAKHAGRDHALMGAMRRFTLYKIAQYSLGAGTASGRARVAGAVAAMRAYPALFEVSRDALGAAFADITRRHLGEP